MYLVSKQILRQSKANVTENRERPTQTPYCGFVLHVTSLLDAVLERFDLAHFYLQDILTSQNVRSEQDLKIFRKDDD